MKWDNIKKISKAVIMLKKLEERMMNDSLFCIRTLERLNSYPSVDRSVFKESDEKLYSIEC